jgi:hypothetical protein
MPITVKMTWFAYQHALEFLREAPDAALVALAGVRRGPGVTEYLVSSLVAEMPLFLEDPSSAPRVRVVRLSAGGRSLPRRLLVRERVDASPALAEVAISPGRAFAGKCVSNGTIQPVDWLDLPGRGMMRLRAGRRHHPAQVAPRLSRSRRVRYSREIGAFGGSRPFLRFQESGFCVVGAGRTGSLVVHDLARLEPRKIVLVDPDDIERHNVPAMDVSMGARTGTTKVRAIQAFLERVRSRVRLESYAASVLSPGVFEAVADADVIVSAVDNSRARLEASLVATLFLKPHLDIGTGILEVRRRIRAGFEVRLIVPGDGCLLCIGGLPNLGRPRPRNFRQERAGSSRFLNQAAAGHGMRLLSRLFEGTLERSQWHRYDERTGGADELHFIRERRRRDCILCGFSGLGERAANRAVQSVLRRLPVPEANTLEVWR